MNLLLISEHFLRLSGKFVFGYGVCENYVASNMCAVISESIVYRIPMALNSKHKWTECSLCSKSYLFERVYCLILLHC